MKKKLFAAGLISAFLTVISFYAFGEETGDWPRLKINEFMASNSSTVLNEKGESGDWFEIINLEDYPVDIAGYYVSDKKEKKLKCKIPEGFPEQTTISPGGVLLLWADEDPDLGPLHTNFKLSKEGESIILTAPDGKTVIDQVDFGVQSVDISYGRKFGEERNKGCFFPVPTPGQLNTTRGFSNIELARLYKFYTDNKAFTGINAAVIIISVLLTTFLTVQFLKLRRLKKQNGYVNLDALTGLPTRAFLDEKLKRMDRENQLPLSIIMGDVNGLKLVNDAFGHYEGDKLLQSIARIIKKCTRQEDIVVRWGGDEFSVLLPKTDEADARKICERIKEACRQEKTDLFPLSIALGYAAKKIAAEDMSEVFREAENMMYKNKFQESKEIHDAILFFLLNKLKTIEKIPGEQMLQIENLASQVGLKLGLSAMDVNSLLLVARLHDIGKVAGSDNIMEEHPVKGYSIVKAIPELAHIADAILSHHECWDGTGYPRKLKGEQIPLFSRIIAIIDSYFQIIRTNPDGIQDALEELKKNAGSKFDPNLVPIVIKTIKDSMT